MTGNRTGIAWVWLGWVAACVAGWPQLNAEIKDQDQRQRMLGSRTDQAYTTENPEQESGITGVLNAIRFGPHGTEILEKAFEGTTREERHRQAAERFAGGGAPGDGSALADICHQLVEGSPEWADVRWVDFPFGALAPLEASSVHGIIADSMKQKIPVILELRRYMLGRSGGDETAPLEWQPAGTIYVAVESVATTCAEDAPAFFLEIVCPRTGKSLPWMVSLPQPSLGPLEVWHPIGIDPANYLEATGPGGVFPDAGLNWHRRFVVLLTGAIGAIP